MKLLKKFFRVVLIILFVLIFSLTNNVFATNENYVNGTKKSSENVKSSENKVTEKKDDEVKNETSTNKDNKALENKANESDTKDKENNESKNDKDNLNYDDEIMLISEEPKKYDKTISSELSAVTSENKTYDGYYIDGNVFILGSGKVKIKNSQIVGNVFITAEEVEFDDTIVNGSLFLFANQITLNVNADAGYITGDKINFEKTSRIKNELRLIGEYVYVDGQVGRDISVFAKELEISKDARIYGNCIIEANKYDIEEDCILGETKINTINYKTKEESIKERLFDSAANIIIVLIITVFVLGGFPKFTAVNKKLRLRDFVKSFFTGLLELVCCFGIAILIMIIGHGVRICFCSNKFKYCICYFRRSIIYNSCCNKNSWKSRKDFKSKSIFYDYSYCHNH